MNTTTDIEAIVEDASKHILRRSRADAWAACAAIWARLFVLVDSGWRRWPEVERTVQEALSAAMSLAVGILPSRSALELTRIHLEGVDIEDDGTRECQFVVDLVSMLSVALSDQPIDVCLDVTLRTYLESIFNDLVNRRATASGRSMSQLAATEELKDDEGWQRAVTIVQSL